MFKKLSEFEMVFTRSSLLVRLEVSALWFVSSSLILLHFFMNSLDIRNKKMICSESENLK